MGKALSLCLDLDTESMGADGVLLDCSLPQKPIAWRRAHATMHATAHAQGLRDPTTSPREASLVRAQTAPNSTVQRAPDKLFTDVTPRHYGAYLTVRVSLNSPLSAY